METDKRKSNKKTLLADDDSTTRTIIADYLEDDGYEVYKFSSPDDIGEIIKECSIIFMDVRFGRDRPAAGLEYLITNIKNGDLPVDTTTIVLYTRWGHQHTDVKERRKTLAELGVKYLWIDIQSGVELIKFREIVRRRGQ